MKLKTLIYTTLLSAFMLNTFAVQAEAYPYIESETTNTYTDYTEPMPYLFESPFGSYYGTVPQAVKVKASSISVSSIKVTWNAIGNHEYRISCVEVMPTPTEYASNIRIKRKTTDSCYVTGLRENTHYVVTVTDLTNNTTDSVLIKTEKVTVLEEFDYVSGWTNCFAYEAASGLTRNPSKAAIANAVIDPVTDTGIMRNEYGDYCVAMGLWYGEVGDRFLVELENGTQFTVQICDSKGLASDGNGIYHTFGFDKKGKCIIEFIHGGSVPYDVKQSGNYGSVNWDGLIFDNIKSICRIDYGNVVEY